MVALALACLAACDRSPGSDDEPQSKLVGTWQRDFEFQGAQGRMTVALAPDRTFTEQVEFTQAGGRVQRLDYAGEWSYDGTKFTRRYLQENGRRYAGGKLRFLTLDLTSVTPREVVGQDNIRGEVLVYRRTESAPRPAP